MFRNNRFLVIGIVSVAIYLFQLTSAITNFFCKVELNKMHFYL